MTKDYLKGMVNSWHIAFTAITCLTTTLSFGQQFSDSSFHYKVGKPLYKNMRGPTICLDEGHNNFHTLNGRYKPFGEVLQNDGYTVISGKSPVTNEFLAKIKILVIANALADTGEWKLPARSAFNDKEISIINHWVKNGGSLFLIADHMPFAGAAAALAKSFGFNFLNGIAFRKDGQPEIFSIKLQTLIPGIIVSGRDISERIDSVEVFTGQGFLPPANAKTITRLNDNYAILFPVRFCEISDTTARVSGLGFSNGASLEYYKGRVVVFGDAGMFTAQLAGDPPEKVGMNHSSAKQNPQLLLNVIHWLDKKM